MEDNEELTTSPTVEQLTNEIDELKENSVPKEDYEKLKQDNAVLIKKLATERPVAKEVERNEPSQEEIFNSIKENSRKMVEGNLNGFEYAELLIENEDNMKKLGLDPFGADDDKTQVLKARNDATSKLLREALEESHGNADLFEHIMESKTIRDI